MKVYAILRPSDAINNDALSAAISKKYPGNFYNLAKGQWLVASDKSVRDLSTELGIEAGRHFGGTLVAEIGVYFGLHNKRLWQWLKRNRGERASNKLAESGSQPIAVLSRAQRAHRYRELAASTLRAAESAKDPTVESAYRSMSSSWETLARALEESSHQTEDDEYQPSADQVFSDTE